LMCIGERTGHALAMVLPRRIESLAVPEAVELVECQHMLRVDRTIFGEMKVNHGRRTRPEILNGEDGQWLSSGDPDCSGE